MPSLIEDYALVGDGHTAALIARSGSVDWLCWPRSDSGACFAARLGTEANGRWLIAPVVDEGAPPPVITRRYRGETLILETSFETPEGAVTVIDFMPPGNGSSELFRIVEGKRGSGSMQIHMFLPTDYDISLPRYARLPYN